ncbi:hypothetical protein [Nonlabens dokdonensis]|nr:hypothetical protein [Nonlabens dokdonensis]
MECAIGRWRGKSIVLIRFTLSRKRDKNKRAAFLSRQTALSIQLGKTIF